MEMIVCIKQVVTGSQVRFDSKTHRLLRSREHSRINPFDLDALALAKELKKKYSATVTALSMGPEISEDVLWEALASGADRAVLLCDPLFASSDTLATSYVLGMGIRKIGTYDLILCGKRTSDSGTGQVGPQLAEELDLPHVTGVERVEIVDRLLQIERTSDGFRERIELSIPALLTVAPVQRASLPSLVEIEDVFSSNQIERWTLQDLKADPGRVGRSGSHTWVETLTPLTRQKACSFIEGDPRQQAKSLMDQLIKKGSFF